MAWKCVVEVGLRWFVAESAAQTTDEIKKHAYRCTDKFPCSTVQVLMKKIITISCLIASLLIILDSVGAWHMFMMFLFVGIIPGTNIALSGLQMLVLILVLSSYAITKIFVLPALRKNGIKLPNKLQLNLDI